MTRTLIILTLALSMLACAVAPSTPPPATVDLSGAAALYVQAPSGARSILAPDGATLMKLLTTGTTGEAVFEDALGQPVTVTILRTSQLTSEYLLAELDYGEATLPALVTLSTGELRAPPVPVDNWERVRVVGGTAYYVSDGALHRVELDTLATTDMSQGDRISGNSLIYVDANGDVHTFFLVNGSIDPANQIRVYFQDGSPFDALGWGSPTAYFLCDAKSFNITVAEDWTTGSVHLMAAGADGLTATRVVFAEDGVSQEAAIVLDADLGDAHTVLTAATGRVYAEDVVFSNGDELASLVVDGSGNITGRIKRALHTYGQPTVYRDGKVYTAGATGVDTMDMASGVADQPVADTGIEALEVVKGQIFYTRSDGVYKYDPVSQDTEKVSDNPAEILAVTR